ncbi:hypothetical protein ACKI2N_032655 [Cupriavidus sp. 30B13]|uniref:hypothetical protein n=1 Tax=Cupriavidus sp. 30B13 TaxID=3384241 RepID=UPI003B8F9BAE
MQPIAIRLGQAIAIEGKTAIPYYDPLSGSMEEVEGIGAVSSKVPASSKEATNFLKDKLPPGVFVVYNESQNLFTLYYGFRRKGTAAVREQKIKEQAAAYKPRVDEMALARKRQANIDFQPFGANSATPT